MPLYLCRPGYLHRASCVLSASTESGLEVAPPGPTITNTGSLVLRASGVPYAELDAIVRIQAGGAARGYALPGAAGYAPGAGAAWKLDGDADTLYRGYTDTPYLVRVAHPIGYGANHAPTSTPRQLADGYMGVFLATTTTAQRFYRVATDWTSSSVLVSSLTLPGTGYRVDYCILPSGRLVAGVHAQGGQDGIQTYYSDDEGATWAALGYSAPGVGAAARDVLCLESVGDDVVAILASSTGATTARILLSRDGGATFTSVDTSTTLTNPRTCVRDGVVIVAHRAATTVYVYPMAPGGGLGTPVATTAGANGVTAIACRDDGVLTALGWEDSGGNDQRMDMSMSLDGGLTWTDPAADPVLDLEQAAYAQNGIDALSAGTWQGSVIAVARADSNTGSDGGLHFLVFGEWATVTDGFGGAVSPEVYQHSYIAIGYPAEFGWTRADTGAGATLANQPYLNIAATGAVNSNFTSSAAWWTTAAGDGKRIRLRVRVNSGGSLADNRSRVRFSMDDGANSQGGLLRFSTTAMRMYDLTGVQIGSDATLDLTGWVDIVIAFAHDTTPGTSGTMSAWYRRDTDAQGVYTSWFSAQASLELAATAQDQLEFGGNVAGAADWDIAYLAHAEAAEGLHDGFTSPADLSPRRLASGFDVHVSKGVQLGARASGGIPGDTYTLATRYGFGKEAIWQELRPSRHWRSSADNTSANVVFDATSGDRFRGDLIALFGTNFRSATWQMNATNSWGAPSVSVSLDATVSTFSATAGVRGMGYVGPLSSADWRPGQWKSDGDGHRWFVEVGGIVYEIDDNDNDRLYVEGIDFSAASGTCYIFGDRMAAAFSFAQHRFARVLVGSQDTADGHYRVGTVICDRAWTPAQLYDYGYVERVEPRVVIDEGESGYRSSARLGPRRYSMAIQWPPIDRMRSATDDLEQRLRDLYAAADGGHRPIVYWRDSADQSTLYLVRVLETYTASNVWGEGTNEVTRVDQLVLSEEL